VSHFGVGRRERAYHSNRCKNAQDNPAPGYRRNVPQPSVHGLLMGVEMRGGGGWSVHEATLHRLSFSDLSLSYPHGHFEISSCQNTPLTDDQGITQAHRPPPSAKSVWEQVGGEGHRVPISSADGTSPRTGHFIFECKSTRPYVSRPSRTQQLAKVNPLDKLKLEGKPSVDVPDEFKTRCVSKTLTNHSHVLTLFAPN